MGGREGCGCMRRISKNQRRRQEGRTACLLSAGSVEEEEEEKKGEWWVVLFFLKNRVEHSWLSAPWAWGLRAFLV